LHTLAICAHKPQALIIPEFFIFEISLFAFQENIELTKEVQELKVNIENAVYLRSQLASQFEDARRRLEDEDRVSH